MSAGFARRFTSYIIDVLIISMVLSLVSMVIPENKTVTKLNEELLKANSEYLESENISDEAMEAYLEKTAPLTYQIDKNNFLTSILGIVVYILYYVVFQYKNNGQTFGKKLMGIKVIKDDGELTINDFIFRSFIINTILFNIIILILLFTTNDMTYVYGVSIISIIQFIVMIVTVFMILLRKDKKALQDVVTKTRVIEVAE